LADRPAYLRLRFEIGGGFGDASPMIATDLHAPLRLSFGDVHLELATPVV
jgi:hypothetical protein